MKKTFEEHLKNLSKEERELIRLEHRLHKKEWISFWKKVEIFIDERKKEWS